MTATEGGIKCTRCGYEFTPSDRLLCRVGDIRFCPSCWCRVEIVSPSRNGDVAGAAVLDDRKVTGDDMAR